MNMKRSSTSACQTLATILAMTTTKKVPVMKGLQQNTCSGDSLKHGILNLMRVGSNLIPKVFLPFKTPKMRPISMEEIRELSTRYFLRPPFTRQHNVNRA